MSISVNREEFLRVLDSVQPGLSPRELLEQSTCFIFNDSTVATFNGEVYCRANLPFKGLTGAVGSAKLLEVLRKLPDTEIVIDVRNGEIVFSGKKRWSGLKLEQEILLPVDQIEEPGEWRELPKGFSEAVDAVQQCAGADQNKFALTCVHLTPQWIEATDDTQLCRWKIDLPLERPTMVRQSSIKHVVSMGLTKISQSENWLHFRGPGPAKVQLSCLCYMDDFPDISPGLKVKGNKVNLPSGLVDAVETAKIFSQENEGGDYVLVQVKPGKLMVKGIGVTGWYKESKKATYTGETFSFMAPPKVLAEVVKRHTECLINPSRLMIKGPNFTYVACLADPNVILRQDKEDSHVKDTASVE